MLAIACVIYLACDRMEWQRVSESNFPGWALHKVIGKKNEELAKQAIKEHEAQVILCAIAFSVGFVLALSVL